MPKKNLPIKYTSRDFDSIRQELEEFAKRYYPDTIKDFSESSVSSMMVDAVSYVGDVLSFYIDYQANEGLIDSAIEYDNILRLAKQMGYKFNGSTSATGKAAFFAIVQANSLGLGPKTANLPILKRNSVFGADSGGTFILTQDVRFDNPNNEVVVARVDTTTGLPTSYAIRAYGDVISGKFEQESIILGAFERFRRLELSANDIVEVISVFDSDGNEYSEVEYLSQDVIYRGVINKDSSTRDEVPKIFQTVAVPRRFVTEREEKKTFLQFGYGDESQTTTGALVDPSTVVMQMYSKDYVTDTSFDPSKLLNTDKFGVGPANTTLTVRYRRNTNTNVNVAVGSLNKVVRANLTYNDPSVVSAANRADILSSIEVSNEEAIVGSVSLPTIEEIRRSALDNFASQSRAVTLKDYQAIAYNMDSQFGKVKRVNVVRDNDSLKRNLNMYVLSENFNGRLISPNVKLKNNLKRWISQYKMINDTIDILDAKIVNFGIEFEIIAQDRTNRFDVLEKALSVVRAKYNIAYMIGESFFLTDVYSVLNKIDGVADVANVKLVNKRGGSYSESFYNIKRNMSGDGRFLKVPENVALEIKFPFSDIKGSVR
jgi:hypothetical protein